MYNIDETVLYGQQGVCKITDITVKEVCGQSIEYYVLTPIFNEKSTIFVPKNNDKLVSKIRKTLNEDEIYNIIKLIPNEKCIWIEDDNKRSAEYKNILSCGNRIKLIQLIKTLYQYKKQKIENGKKLHISDEHFLKEAEKMLYDEFATVLNIDRNEVLPFIREHIETNKACE